LPTDHRGDGHTCPDAALGDDGTVLLRAERAGPPSAGDGRVYHIDFTAEDGSGESCEGTVTVCVPHDQGGGECEDGGPVYDSMTCDG